MEFVKMHGLGNDFIIFSLLKEDLSLTPNQVRFLCQRRVGIGADGIIFILPPKKGHDFRMRTLNRDGTEAPMCGNGIRCFGHYLFTKGLTKAPTISIETMAGVMLLSKEGEGLYQVDLGPPFLGGKDVPIKDNRSILEEEVEIGDHTFSITCMKLGNPHTIIFVEDAEKVPLTQYGPLIEEAPLFPQKTNVEFVSLLSPNKLRMRVWERGVGVTKACGSGAAAAAVAAILTGRTKEKVTVKLDGGDLFISWYRDLGVKMTGPATMVYRGELDLKELKKGCC